jgi:hypothetical protein
MKTKKHSHPRQLIIPDNYDPLPQDEYDEAYSCGIFTFNVTSIITYTENHIAEIQLSSVIVSDWHRVNELKEEHINMADLNRPVVLAEIAPDKLGVYPHINPSDWRARGYVLLDGHHRVEKAYRQGIEQLSAYILKMEQHFSFIYSGYKEYANYWNGKLRDYEKNCIEHI